MNKQERVTNYIYGMFDKENVQIVIPDCVQNDCYMEGSVDGKIVIYNICNCSKNLLFHSAWALNLTYGVSCVPRFDHYFNSGTLRVLIKGAESEESL